jgi:hypothetical protein
VFNINLHFTDRIQVNQNCKYDYVIKNKLNSKVIFIAKVYSFNLGKRKL